MFTAFLFALMARLPDGIVAALGFSQVEEEDPGHGFTGFTGFAADVIEAMGEIGVGVLAFVETVFPPIPSEIVLALAGYLSETGDLNFGLVIVTSTSGSVAGALVLYALGAWFGEARAKWLMSRIPLVEMADLDKASRWFHHHGTRAVFIGRFIPIVRSLVSLPAGAQRMSLVPFIVLTTVGSGIWNAALISAGYALGTQFEKVDRYTQYLDYAVAAAVLLFLAWYFGPKLKRQLASRGV
ncbi:MAG: DedA family protein [Tepidiformaceae bacterium]